MAIPNIPNVNRETFNANLTEKDEVSLGTRRPYSNFFQVGDDTSLTKFVVQSGFQYNGSTGAVENSYAFGPPLIGSSVVISASGDKFGVGGPQFQQPIFDYSTVGTNNTLPISGAGGVMFFQNFINSNPKKRQIGILKGGPNDTQAHMISGLGHGHYGLMNQQAFSYTYYHPGRGLSDSVVVGNPKHPVFFSQDNSPGSNEQIHAGGHPSDAAENAVDLDFGESMSISRSFEWLIVGAPQNRKVGTGTEPRPALYAGVACCFFRSLSAATISNNFRQRFVGWHQAGMFTGTYINTGTYNAHHDSRRNASAHVLSGDAHNDRFGTAVAMQGLASVFSMQNRNRPATKDAADGRVTSNTEVQYNDINGLTSRLGPPPVVFVGAHPKSSSKECYTYMYSYSGWGITSDASNYIVLPDASGGFNTFRKDINDARSWYGGWVKFGVNPMRSSGALYHSFQENTPHSQSFELFDDYHNYGCIKMPDIGRNLKTNDLGNIVIGNGRRKDVAAGYGSESGLSPVRVYKYVVRNNAGETPAPNHPGDYYTTSSNTPVAATFDLKYNGGSTAIDGFTASMIQQGDDLNYGIPVAERSPNKGLAMNRDGSRVAFSYAIDSTATPAGVGKVKVYDRDLSNTTVAPTGWRQVGNTLIGDNANDAFGYSIDMNDVGDVMVVTALEARDDNSLGYTKVFKLSTADFPTGDKWQQIGHTLRGKNPGDNPVSCAMNAAGDQFIVGNDTTTYQGNLSSGTARLYASNDITT